jgi:hypothetical protein
MPDDLSVHWFARKQELQGEGDLATSLVTKVDALSKAAIDLAFIKKEAQILKAKSSYKEMQRTRATDLEARNRYLKELAESQIRDIQSTLEKTLLEAKDHSERLVEQDLKVSQLRMGQAEKEYSDFLDKVTTNCASYIEQIMLMDQEHLAKALQEFNTEVSKWLLPEV